MITVFDEQSIRYSALNAGASDFLSKPIDHLDKMINIYNKFKDVNKQYGQTDLQLCKPNNH